jgi:hypothetical protein
MLIDSGASASVIKPGIVASEIWATHRQLQDGSSEID